MELHGTGVLVEARGARSGRIRGRHATRIACRRPSRALLLLLALAAGLVSAPPARAKVFASQKQALAEAFPEATRIERRTFILSRDQAARLEALTGRPVDAKVVVIHVAHRDDRVIGFAEIAVHKVRTQPEAMLIVLTPEGVVRSVRIIAFHEPLDYLPTDRWYAQLGGTKHGDRLNLGRDVHGVVGATLSAQAAVDAVRRILAYWEVLLRPDYGSAEASP
ncbi:MAG: FMN-binding protein [Myxococcota bacterium]